MSLGRQTRRDPDDALAPRSLLRPYRTTWAGETFVESFEAQIALSEDRPAFISRRDIMALIPDNIKLFIMHTDPRAQIDGFQELFVLLNNDPNRTTLRRLIEAYFNDSPPLRGHLSQ